MSENGKNTRHVAMVVNGDIAMDARVRKSAQSVADLGYRVTLLYGQKTSEKPVHGTIGAVETVGLPLLNPLAVAKAKLAKDRATRTPGFPGYISETELEWAETLRAAESLRAAGYPLPKRLWSRAGRMVGQWRSNYHRTRQQRLEAELEERTPDDLTDLDWQTEVTIFADVSVSFTQELWRLRPDIIHAHDAHVLEAASSAANYLKRKAGYRPTLIYDAHEFVQGAVRANDRDRQAWARMERTYIGGADAVITVSESIADELQSSYRLRQRPTVVLNAPLAGDRAAAASDIRTDAGVAADVPLVVYSGLIAPIRGVPTVVQALTELPDVHLAVVAVPRTTSPHAKKLVADATQAGVADRLHLVEPVPPEHVVDYMRTADLGIHPMVGDIPNHEMALPNKLFDYLFAGLPIVVSDLREMGTFVRRTGVGATFTHSDASSCAQAIRTVLENNSEYRAAVATADLERDFSWQAQVTKLAALYRSFA